MFNYLKLLTSLLSYQGRFLVRNKIKFVIFIYYFTNCIKQFFYLLLKILYILSELNAFCKNNININDYNQLMFSLKKKHLNSILK